MEKARKRDLPRGVEEGDSKKGKERKTKAGMESWG